MSELEEDIALKSRYNAEVYDAVMSADEKKLREIYGIDSNVELNMEAIRESSIETCAIPVGELMGD